MHHQHAAPRCTSRAKAAAALAFAAAVTLLAPLACTSTDPSPAGAGPTCPDRQPAEACQTLCNAICAKLAGCGEVVTSCRERCFTAHVEIGENCAQDQSICGHQNDDLQSAGCSDVCAWTSTASSTASSAWFVCVHGPADGGDAAAPSDASGEGG